MSLTGSGFWWLLVLLTVGSFGLLVWKWPRLGGAKPQLVAARIGSLVGINLLVLLTAAVQLNDTYLIFAGWSDLSSAISGKVSSTTLDSGARVSESMRAPVKGQHAVAATSYPRLPQTGPGNTLVLKVRGPKSGLTGTIDVQLPLDYRQGSSTTYPVLETFSGYPGLPAQWIQTMDLGGVMQQQVTAHQLANAIIVSPQSQFPQGVDTECINSPGGPQVQTWLTQDVPDVIARTFHVRTERSSWATIGLSAGAYCAAMVAMKAPAQFSAAIVMGGYFRPEFGIHNRPLSLKSPVGLEYDLIRLAAKHPPAVAMWLETSHSDRVSYESSTKFLNQVRKPTSVHTVVLRNAGHWIGLWQELLPGALNWLGANVPGFRP